MEALIPAIYYANMLPAHRVIVSFGVHNVTGDTKMADTKQCAGCTNLLYRGSAAEDGPRWARRKWCSVQCMIAHNGDRMDYKTLHKRANKSCQHCSTPFITGGRAGDIDKKFCSIKCAAVHRNKSGILGRKVNGDGYVAIYTPDHPNAHRGYVAEHVLVAEKYLGRHVAAGEHIHHLNTLRSDNRPENLLVTSGPRHSKIHKDMARIYSQMTFSLPEGYVPDLKLDLSDCILIGDLKKAQEAQQSVAANAN